MNMQHSYGSKKKTWALGKDEVRCWMCSNYKSGFCTKFTTSISNSRKAIDCDSYSKRQKPTVKITVDKSNSNKGKLHKWYAIKETKGIQNKIVTSWAECEKLTRGNYSVYKSFSTEAQARKYLKGK